MPQSPLTKSNAIGGSMSFVDCELSDECTEAQLKERERISSVNSAKFVEVTMDDNFGWATVYQGLTIVFKNVDFELRDGKVRFFCYV